MDRWGGGKAVELKIRKNISCQKTSGNTDWLKRAQ